MQTYASPTMSDQALLPVGVPSLKIGPGNSARSHTPDEWIGVDEVESGIVTFIHLLEATMRSLQ
jgi:acetylornithine deacetylase